MAEKKKYTLRIRATSLQQTRGRIVEAAAQAFAVRGIRHTSMQEVARRADVSPTTVTNHFSDPNELALAVVEHVIELMALPSVEIFDEVDTLDERIALLIQRVYECYGRSEPWVMMHEEAHHEMPILDEGPRRVAGICRELVASALGPLADDAKIRRLVNAALHPGFRLALIRHEVNRDEASELAHQLVMRWLSQEQVGRSLECAPVVDSSGCED